MPTAEDPRFQPATDNKAGVNLTRASWGQGGSRPPRLPRLVMLRYGFIDDRPRTLEEVGQEFGVSKERIRQLEQQALAKLRQSGKFAYPTDPPPP